MASEQTALYDMALVSGNEDIVIIHSGYCKVCIYNKIKILKLFNITLNDVHKLKKCGVKILKIKCDC
jgi:hypothetical protein